MIPKRLAPSSLISAHDCGRPPPTGRNACEELWAVNFRVGTRFICSHSAVVGSMHSAPSSPRRSDAIRKLGVRTAASDSIVRGRTKSRRAPSPNRTRRDCCRKDTARQKFGAHGVGEVLVKQMVYCCPEFTLIEFVGNEGDARKKPILAGTVNRLCVLVSRVGLSASPNRLGPRENLVQIRCNAGRP